MMENARIKDSIKAIVYLLILTLINIYLPFFSMLIIIIWPIPVAIITLKYNFNIAAGVIGVTAIINGIFFGPIMGLLAVIGFGLVGFVIGSCLKEDIKPLYTLLLTVFSVLVSHLLLIIISYYMLGIDFQSIISEATTLLGQTGTMGDMEGIIVDQLQILEKIFPALIAISAVITGTLNYYVTIWYIDKAGFKKESYMHVKYWFLPRWIISIGIVIALLLKGNLLFVNLNMVLLFFTLIQGYAVSIFFIDKKFKSFVFKLIYTAIILFVPVLPPFLILLGLADFWFDFRKIKYNKKED